jgi:hypothetical protein
LTGRIGEDRRGNSKAVSSSLAERCVVSFHLWFSFIGRSRSLPGPREQEEGTITSVGEEPLMSLFFSEPKLVSL